LTDATAITGFAAGWVLGLPVVIPLAASAVGLVLRERPVLQRIVGVSAAALHLLVSSVLVWRVAEDGVLVAGMGGWAAPYGIVLAADLFGAGMVAIAALMGLVVAIFALGEISEAQIRFGFYSLYHLLLAGVCGAFLTGDIFNLYVWFEVMLMSSFVLMVLGGGRAQMEGAVKYVTINLFSSVIFLTAVGILYGKTGTLNYADLSMRLEESAGPPLVSILSVMFLVVFGIKAGMFPLFFWLPASYHTPPIPVTTLFSALLTKVGVFALVRAFTLIFPPDDGFMSLLLAWIAGLTMVTGVLGAIAQYDIRRLLSFHIISQIGYLLMGLSLAMSADTPADARLAISATIFFMLHVIVAKSGLFLIAGVIKYKKGTFDLKRLGGLYREDPFLAVLFLVSALALAGLPPFSGFFAKFALIRSSLQIEAYGLAATGLVVSMLTLFSMMKIWAEAFWKDPPGPPLIAPVATPPGGLLVGPVVVLALLSAGMGLAAEPFAQFATEAAKQVLDREGYIAAVLGAAP